MKKKTDINILLSGLLVLVCMITLSGCGSGYKSEKGQVCFNSGIPAGEEFHVTTDVVAGNGAPEMKVDDNIRVVFNGGIMESDPLQLGTVYAIYLLDENGEVISNE
ncbi:MAG: hypothetical protein SOT05_05120 [Anaerovoracaceae bacterium]|nr:hypothetical protein [Anaerovoracaceae bacterium]